MNKKNILIMIVLILHFVGSIGTIYPAYSFLFIQLTPLNLLISSIILIVSDQDDTNNLFGILTITSLFGFFIEVAGVSTGYIFGIYQYGATLGFKLFEVPLIIGLNWFILTYITHHFTFKVKNHLIAASIGALIMTLTDMLIEPVAIKLSYWSWSGDEIPLQNYTGWFGVSFILHLIIRYRFKSQSFNELTVHLFAAQLFYFLMVFLFY